MSTTQDAILDAVAALLATDGFFPPVPIDEAEPSVWELVADAPAAFAGRMRHACAVQGGPPPDHLAHVRGGGDAEELELEAAVAYACRVDLGPDQAQAQVRAARRARRAQAIKRLAALIDANRTLGLGPEVWAELAPAQRDDDIAFQGATGCATAVIPVRVLYTAAHAAA